MPPVFHSRSPDTDPEIEARQIELLRCAPASRRATLSLSLTATVISLARRGIRRAMPEASEQDVALRFVELHYGRELALALRRHLTSRGR